MDLLLILIALLVGALAFSLAYRLIYVGQVSLDKAKRRVRELYQVEQVLVTADPKSPEYILAAAGIRTNNPPLIWTLIRYGPGAAALVILTLVGFPITVALGAAFIALIAPRQWVEGRAKDRGRRIDEELPMAYARLNAILRANVGVGMALVEVANSLEHGKDGPTPLSLELRQTAQEIADSGIGLQKAFSNMQQRAASQSLANLALLLERFAQTAAGQGGTFYDAFETAAQNVQGILEARDRAKSKAAEQMQSARIMPGIMAVALLFFMNDPSFRGSFQLPIVQLALAASVVFMYLGYMLMSDIAREAV